MNNAHTRTLQRALEACGGAQQLADILGVSTDRLACWTEGLETLPDRAYFVALDIVARGPLQPLRKKIA